MYFCLEKQDQTLEILTCCCCTSVREGDTAGGFRKWKRSCGKTSSGLPHIS